MSNIVAKVHHHIRHTRPKWYHDYHKWEHHETFHWITFSLSTVVMLLGFMNAVMLMQRYNLPANAATTSVSQTVSAGTLTINPAPIATLSAVTTNVTASQNSTGSLGTVTVTDNRGTGAGWNAVAVCSQFFKYNSVTRTGGAVGALTIDSSSVYNNVQGGLYTVTITTGGVVGVARFSLVGAGENLSNQLTSSSGSYGTHGLILNFAAGTYVASGSIDSWTFRVDVIPVTGLTITPGSLTSNFSADPTNVTAGSAHTFSGVADSTSLIQATTGYGLGSYSVTPSLQLSIPAFTYSNSYTAIMTETVS